MSENEGGESKSVGAFLLGFLTGVLVCLGAGGALLLVVGQRSTMAAREAMMARDEAEARAQMHGGSGTPAQAEERCLDRAKKAFDEEKARKPCGRGQARGEKSRGEGQERPVCGRGDKGMTTAVKLGPADRGRPMTWEEYLAGDYTEGYHYEIIDGKLYVSPLPNQPENSVEDWIFFHLKVFTRQHPEIVNYATNKARVFVSGRADITAPEPDIAVYKNYPLNRRFTDLQWQEVSPVLVVEILSHEDPDKDLVRNRDLYLEVASIKEYWLLDTRPGALELTMTAFRRYGKRWRPRDLVAGDTYTTRLLPGFELVLDPSR